MGKGTGSFGKRRNKSHTLCVRCGRRSFHIQKSRCSACAYPAARKRTCKNSLHCFKKTFSEDAFHFLDLDLLLCVNIHSPWSCLSLICIWTNLYIRSLTEEAYLCSSIDMSISFVYYSLKCLNFISSLMSLLQLIGWNLRDYLCSFLSLSSILVSLVNRQLECEGHQEEDYWYRKDEVSP